MSATTPLRVEVIGGGITGSGIAEVPITFSEDEGIRAGTTAESLARLSPAFDAADTITAGSAAQLSDGAAAVVVMSKATARKLGDALRRWDEYFGDAYGVLDRDTSCNFLLRSGIAWSRQGGIIEGHLPLFVESPV